MYNILIQTGEYIMEKKEETWQVDNDYIELAFLLQYFICDIIENLL